jgi:hypothetical protein
LDAMNNPGKSISSDTLRCIVYLCKLKMFRQQSFLLWGCLLE